MQRQGEVESRNECPDRHPSGAQSDRLNEVGARRDGPARKAARQFPIPVRGGCGRAASARSSCAPEPLGRSRGTVRKGRGGTLRPLLLSAARFAVAEPAGGIRRSKAWIHRLFTTLNCLERQEDRANGSDFGFSLPFNLLISRCLSNPCAGVNGARRIPETSRPAGASGNRELSFHIRNDPHTVDRRPVFDRFEKVV